MGLSGAYEPVDNYVYTLSRRKIAKLTFGRNFSTVAFESICDYYETDAETAPADDSSDCFRRVKQRIRRQENHSRPGIAHPGLPEPRIFKVTPSPVCRDLLLKTGSGLPGYPAIITFCRAVSARRGAHPWMHPGRAGNLRRPAPPLPTIPDHLQIVVRKLLMCINYRERDNLFIFPCIS
jgi:hypothetical protein